MRILFTGGGTGGHVYPALAVIDRLLAWESAADIQVAWVGRPDSVEEDLVGRHGIAFWPISTGALRGRSPVQVIGSAVSLFKGIVQGRRLVWQWKPDVVFSTGGYVTAPLTLAAWLGRVPVVIYLPDMEPGLAIKLLARFATHVCVSFDSVAQYFDPHKVIVTGYPVRQDVLEVNRDEARSRLGLDPGRYVLLVLGGSSGAHSINEAVSRHLPELLSLAQVVHVSGPGDLEELSRRTAQLSEQQRSDYHLYGYLHGEMADALAAADLVVARAGASTLAEFPAASLAAILVPYPHAGPNQGVNAAFLKDRGGAIVLPDAELDTLLVAEVRSLLSDQERLATMSVAMRAIAVPDAADRLASCLVRVGGSG